MLKLKGFNKSNIKTLEGFKLGQCARHFTQNSKKDESK